VSTATYFDGTHERVVTVVEKLKTEVTEVESDAQCRPPSHVSIHDRSAVFRSLATGLVAIKLYVVNGFQRVVTDQISVGNGLDVCNDKCSAKC